jgi:hypothetical protein
LTETDKGLFANASESYVVVDKGTSRPKGDKGAVA